MTTESQVIPVNALARHIQPVQDALTAAASEVIASGYVVLGPRVKEFEQAFAEYCGAGACIGLANGTDALELGLKAAGVVPGDTVAAVANAAMYGTTAILAAGAQPTYVDVGADANIDPAALRRLLAAGPAPKAIIITHLYGRLADMDALLPMCRGAGIAVIEDCAQAHGATDRLGRRAGSFGDVAAFSFYPTKNLGALGDGGAVVTSNEELAARARQLRQYGWSRKYENTLRGGRNSRLDEIQAAMLQVMLPHLDDWNRRRVEVATRYSARISNPRIQVPEIPPNGHVAHLYVVQSEQRDALQQHLLGHGIGTDVHYPVPDHHQAVMSDRAWPDLPETERQCATVLTLPCFPELTDAEVDRVIEACNRF